jgi:hypothetical protein
VSGTDSMPCCMALVPAFGLTLLGGTTMVAAADTDPILNVPSGLLFGGESNEPPYLHGVPGSVGASPPDIQRPVPFGERKEAPGNDAMAPGSVSSPSPNVPPINSSRGDRRAMPSDAPGSARPLLQH